jgi:hypothetical protein
MKKISFVTASLISLNIFSNLVSVQASTCVDLQSVLAKGAENSKVLSLQNFLFDKGYLKAKPNGYFGVGTFAAVKAYQKSLGLAQVGSVGPGTRAAIKRDSCGANNQTNQTSQTSQPTSTTQSTVSTKTETVTKPTVPVVTTPSGLRNAQRREDITKLLQNLYQRFSDSRGVRPVAVTDTPIELCVVPPYVPSTATATEVAVLVTPDSPCKDYVDVSYLSPMYMSWIPRDPSLATSSNLTGYTITRSDANDITIAAKNPEDGAIIKVMCNFNGFCKDIQQISTVIYGTPVFSSSSMSIILRDAVPQKPIMLYGKNFTATNTVTLFSNYSNKSYVLGIFPSTDGTSLPLSATSTTQTFPCGIGCNEKMPLGDYSFSITNDGGKSNLGYLTLKGITTSALSVHGDTSVTPKTSGVKVGSFTISSSMPVQLKTLTLSSTSTSTDLPSKISGLTLKDATGGFSVGGGPAFSLSNTQLYENQSKVYDLYVDVAQVDTYQSGLMTYGGYFTVTDPFTGADMDVPVKDIAFTVSY